MGTPFLDRKAATAEHFDAANPQNVRHWLLFKRMLLLSPVAVASVIVEKSLFHSGIRGSQTVATVIKSLQEG